jgi:hypothetical protein
MSGVRDEGDRVREHAENHLGDDERNVEHSRDGESPTEIRRRVAVPVAVVVPAAIVVVIMAVVIMIVMIVVVIMVVIVVVARVIVVEV